MSRKRQREAEDNPFADDTRRDDGSADEGGGGDGHVRDGGGNNDRPDSPAMPPGTAGLIGSSGVDGEISDEELYTKITRIGDKTGLQAQIDDLRNTILIALDTKMVYIVDTLFQSVTQLTTKTSIYATVVALVAIDNLEFADEVLKEAVHLLEDTLKECEWNRAMLLVRFLTDMANTALLSSPTVLKLLNLFLAECEQPGVHVQRADTFCYIVLAALPWCARSLHENAPGVLQDCLRRIEKFLGSRKPCSAARAFPTTTSSSSADILDVMWAQTQSFVANNFSNISATVRAHTLFEEEFKADSTPLITRPLPPFMVPSHLDTFIYIDKPTPLHIFYAWDEKTKRQEEVTVEELKAKLDPGASSDPDLPHFIHRMRVSPIDRLVTSLYVADTLFFWNAAREDCVKKLRLLPLKGALEPLVVEGILSHLFALPQSTFSHVYYASLLVDLCKIDFHYPVIIIEALEALYDRVPSMDNELVDRLVHCYAFVLSNYGYKWLWDDWSSVLDLADAQNGTCLKLFIYEVFSALLRHSYRERLLDVIPAVFHKFIPDAPRHCFKWDMKRYRDKEPPPFKSIAEAVYNAIHSAQFSCDEITLEIDRMDWSGELKNEDRIEILMHCILINGIETITHQLNALKKYRGALEAVLAARPAERSRLRLQLVLSATQFWDTSPQHQLIVIQQLLDLRLVDPVDVIHWLFSTAVTAKWERGYPWEAARNTIDGLITEVMSAFGEWRKLERRAKGLEKSLDGADNTGGGRMNADALANRILEAEEVSKKARNLYRMIRSDLMEQLKLVFFELFRGFRTVLNDHYKKTTSGGAASGTAPKGRNDRLKAKEYVWLKSAVSHFNEFGRKYQMFAFPWLDELRATVFQTEGTDPRILEMFDSWQGLLYRRWGVAKGFNSDNVQRNTCLQLFLHIASGSMVEADPGEGENNTEDPFFNDVNGLGVASPSPPPPETGARGKGDQEDEQMKDETESS